jgi:hypothetical protein
LNKWNIKQILKICKANIKITQKNNEQCKRDCKAQVEWKWLECRMQNTYKGAQSGNEECKMQNIIINFTCHS